MTKLRIITFVLAIILAFSALVACDTAKPSETTREQTTEEKSSAPSESETTERQTQAPDKPTDGDEEESTASSKPNTPDKPSTPTNPKPNRPNNPQPKPETVPDVVETTEIEHTETVFEDEEETFDENVLETGDIGNYQSDFFLSNCDDVNPMRYYWADPSRPELDQVYEAVYARQQKLQDHLGVTITVSDAGGFMEYVSNFKTAVKTNSDSVHTLLTHVSTGVPSLVSEGYLQDIGSMPGIDLNQDYWNREFMDELSFEGASKTYYFLGFSDFNILYTHVIAFNKQMMSQATNGVYDKSVYQMVIDYEWTLDRMLDIAQLVSIDPTGDGKTTDDTYGLTGQQWVPWIGLMHASGINYVEKDPSSGDYKIAMMNEMNREKTSMIVAKLKEFSASKYGYFVFKTSAPVDVQLTSGRALMQLASTYNLVGFLDSDITFGVLCADDNVCKSYYV